MNPTWGRRVLKIDETPWVGIIVNPLLRLFVDSSCPDGFGLLAVADEDTENSSGRWCGWLNEDTVIYDTEGLY